MDTLNVVSNIGTRRRIVLVVAVAVAAAVDV